MYEPWSTSWHDKETAMWKVTPTGDAVPTCDHSEVAGFHYDRGGIEAIEYMKAKSTLTEYRGYLRLTVLKYLSRVGTKGEEEMDVRKGHQFLGFLVDTYDEGYTHAGDSERG